MENKNIKKIEDLLSGVLKCSKDLIQDTNGPNQISNWDSITHMELVSKVEEEFGIQFDIDEINQIDTIGALKNLLNKHGVL
jgi:acyl carrier protein